LRSLNLQVEEILMKYVVTVSDDFESTGSSAHQVSSPSGSDQVDYSSEDVKNAGKD